MLALYRAGRQADALEIYQCTRAHLASELGLEPGPAAQRPADRHPRTGSRAESADAPATRGRRPQRICMSACRTATVPETADDGRCRRRAGLQLPTGTVTFMFTDIEDSTDLLRSLSGEAFGQELSAPS